MSQRQKVSWSNLPEELLYPIAHRLETRLDILNFRAVCKEWRNSVSLTLVSDKNILSAVLPHKLSTTNPPLLRGGAATRMEDEGGYFVYHPVFLTAGSIYLIKPAFDLKLSPWVMTVEELNPGKLVLRRPLCRSAVGNLPWKFPKKLDLSRFEVVEMGRVYSLRYDVEPFHLFEEKHKVLLLTDNFGGGINPKIEDYTAVVLYDCGVLAAINLKNEVVKEACFKSRKFDDIVMYKGVIHSIDRYGRLYSMDYNRSNGQLKMLIVVKEALYSAIERKSRIFESCGELYLVRKCMVCRVNMKRKTMGLRVYKLNHETNAWDELDSIGDDRILFVTPDCGFFAKVADFPGWKGNRIVVHSYNSFPSYCHTFSYQYDQEYHDFLFRDPYKKTGLEVFHFEDCVFSPVELDPDYAVVFCSPPKWISPNTR